MLVLDGEVDLGDEDDSKYRGSGECESDELDAPRLWIAAARRTMYVPSSGHGVTRCVYLIHRTASTTTAP